VEGDRENSVGGPQGSYSPPLSGIRKSPNHDILEMTVSNIALY